MKIEKSIVDNQELEITVVIPFEEMKPHLESAAAELSKTVAVEGFRAGHVPYDVLKNKIGEMQILQKAADLAVQKTADKALQSELKDEKELKPIGQPQVNVTKLAADNPFEYKIIVSLMPEIKVGKYKDLKIKKQDVAVDDKEVAKVITDLQAMRVKEVVVDREIKQDDKALVDIEMFLDNVPVDGGAGKGTAVLVGANYIVPGFDKEIIGARKGETKEFKLEYPKDHHQKNLAGKMVDFRVTIKDVYERELPEVNDEFVKNLGAKDVIDLKDKIKENLAKEKQSQSEQKAVMNIFETILDKTTFSHVPQAMIDSEVHNMIHELKNNVEQQGGKFDDYLLHIKKTPEEIKKDLRPDAEKRVKTSLVISQVVKAEDIKVSDEELQKAVDEKTAAYADNPEYKKKADTPEFRNYLQYNLLNQKVINNLKDWNLDK